MSSQWGKRKLFLSENVFLCFAFLLSSSSTERDLLTCRPEFYLQRLFIGKSIIGFDAKNRDDDVFSVSIQVHVNR